MRLIRVLFLFLIVSTLVMFVNSCCSGGYEYEWVYIMSDNLEGKGVSHESEIAKENFGIRIELFNRKYTNNNEINLVNSAYALTCKPMFRKKDSIIDIRITTINQFDSLHGSFTDVSDSFYGYSEAFYITNDSLSLDSLVEEVNVFDYTAIENLDFYLHNQNVLDSTHQFIVEILLSDNRVLIDTTDAIILY